MARTQQISSNTLAFISFAAMHWIGAAKRVARALFLNDAPRAHVIEHAGEDRLSVSIPASRSMRRYALLAALTIGLSIGANRIANTLVCNVGVDLTLWLPRLLPLLALTYACARVLIDQATSVLTEETLTVSTDGLSRRRGIAGFSLCTVYPAEAIEHLRVIDGARPIAFFCGSALRCGAGLSQAAARQIVATITQMHPRWACPPGGPADQALLDAPCLETLPGHNAGHDTAILVPLHTVA
jgi:hypothetical protein